MATRSRLAAVVALVGVFVWLAAGCDPAPGQAVGPNQHFQGLVNGTHTDAQITVACPGPATVGRTTHPLAGQTLSVHQVSSGGGTTGPSPTAVYATGGAGVKEGSASFTVYDTTADVPTTWTVPCEGTGTVTFSTCFDVLPCPAGSVPDVVKVQFVNLAV